jgi:hypothetical protein
MLCKLSCTKQFIYIYLTYSTYNGRTGLSKCNKYNTILCNTMQTYIHTPTTCIHAHSCTKRNYHHHHHHHHHHHLASIQLGHLLTRSGLTHPNCLLCFLLPVQRLKIAILPPDSPCCGLVTYSTYWQASE